MNTTTTPQTTQKPQETRPQTTSPSSPRNSAPSANSALTPSSPPALFLDPSPTQASHLINAFADPHLSYHDLAEGFHTTVEAIALWITKEDINKRLDALEFAFARRARLLSTNALPAAIDTLQLALKNARQEEASFITNPTSLQAAEQRRRARVTINQLTKTLQTLSTLTPPAKRTAPGTTNPFNPTYSPEFHADWEAKNKASQLAQRAGQAA